jgi:dinuclear metal center YbgI/SA1388 family protein
MRISDILTAVNTLAPPALAEEWDNTGLLVGDISAPADKAGVCLDITRNILELAVSQGISCLISHHPVIFMPKEAKFLAPGMAFALARAGICAIAAHTNLDRAPGGVNDTLAERLALTDILPLPLEDDPSKPAMLRSGLLEKAVSAEGFARFVSGQLNARVRYCDAGRRIKRIALCSGGAGEYADACARLGFDAYVTGEARHHEFLSARAAGISLFAAGHFETERPVAEPFAAELRKALPGLEVIVLPEENPVRTV